MGKIAVLGISMLGFFWSVAFVDFWARAEARYRMAWGMAKFQQRVGEWTHDSVSGLWTEKFSFKRACRISTIHTFVMIWISTCW